MSREELIAQEWERVKVLLESGIKMPKIYPVNREYQGWRKNFMDAGFLIPRKGPKNIQERRARQNAWVKRTRKARPRPTKKPIVSQKEYWSRRLIREMLATMAEKQVEVETCTLRKQGRPADVSGIVESVAQPLGA